MLVVLLVAVIVAVVIIISSQAGKSSNQWMQRPKRRQKTVDKGAAGEYMVALVLGGNIAGVQYIVNDLTISERVGQSSQVDHILINTLGIWVIETKNYAGKIYGTEEAKEWHQYLAGGNTQNSFYNPKRQNASHIYNVKKALDIKNDNILHGVVVFPDPSVDLSHVSASGVCYLDNLKLMVQSETGVRLTDGQMIGFYNHLMKIKSSNTVSLQEHVNNIHTTQQNIANDICPRCGAKLEIRNGQYGQFKGCTNYPRCKFKKNL